MRKYKYNWTAKAAVILSGILAFGDVLPAAAASVTYGQYVSGAEAQEVRKDEESYTMITISSEEDLVWLARECSLDSWSRDKYIKLEEDIVLQEEKAVMIPTFGGIFDGCGHSIMGLELLSAGSSIGLFRYIQAGGIVRNLTVSGLVQPEGSKSRTGLLAGVNYGSITDCQVSGTVAGAEKVGGIAGVNETSGEIRNCQSAAIVVGDHYTGGICGLNRGTLNNCSNSGNINTYSMDVSYGIEDITIENLEERDDMERIAVHTDTGGIAGYSQGKIYYCSNSGTVGYQHVGYNTGGIVGRLHQGYLQNCTNTGHILGRKDVGGIAGQMEPFLEIRYLNDKLSEIDREADVFFDLLEETQEELSHYSGQAADLTREISTHLRNASAAAGNLTGTANDLWYIYNQELTGINNDLKRLNQEWSDQAAADRDKQEQQPDSGNGDNADRPHITVSGNDIVLPGGSWDGDIDIGDTDIGDIDVGFGADVESYLAALRRFGEGTSSHLDNITAATNDRSGGISSNLEILNKEMDAAGSGLQQLSEVLDQGSGQVSAKTDALIAQARALRRSISELRDDLFRYEGISVEDNSDETAGGQLEHLGAEQVYYDTSSFQQGKITLCINKGTIEADTNVGGIAGQVATEYDFDPEDDITVSGTESFHLEQSIKAVVRESRNLGKVTGKKNYVGGIVGKADYGAVISCESYGNVESTDGSYVGGIAGSSGYCIRSCYSMGALSGKDYVGGIVGSGCDIFYSYAYPELQYSGEGAGSIAGKLQEEGVIYGNYYIDAGTEEAFGSSPVPGVDGVGYEEGAAPLDYETFRSMEGVPEAFSKFTISFQAQGKELASFSCSYGGTVDRELIPEIPAKEGYYGYWPEFDYDHVTGNKVMEAQYEKWVTSLASEEKNEDGKALVIVQGEFLPENRLLLEQTAEGTKLSVVYAKQDEDTVKEYADPIVVRVLCEKDEEYTVELWEDGAYKAAASRKVGSYLDFSMEKPGMFRLTVPHKSRGWIPAAATAAAAMILILTFVLEKRHNRRKKKKADHSESKL